MAEQIPVFKASKSSAKAALEADMGDVMVETRAPEPETEVIPPPAAETSKRVTIVLEENSDIPPTGLFVGLNGRGYLIVAGEPVSLPVEVLGVLDEAITSAPQVNPQTLQVEGYRPRMRFPYRRVG